MEPESEPPVCPVCIVFEPQAWRKSLCRNCFKTFEQHGEEGTEDSGEEQSESPSCAVHTKDAKPSASKDSTQKTSVKESTQKPAEKSPSSSSASSSPSSSKPSSCTATPGSKLSSSKSSASTTATTTTTTTASSNSKSSKAKDMASRFEDKGSKGSSKPSSSTTSSSKTSATSSLSTSPSKTSTNTTTPQTSSSKTSSTFTATTSKTGTEKKASSKTDTTPKRGSPENKPTPSNSRSPLSTDVKPKTTAGSEKKLSALSPGKTAGGKEKEKEKDTQPSPPSPSLSDNSARAKWDKRSSGGGGGTGGKTDVTKGQKSAGEAKGTRGESTNGSGGVGKSRLADVSSAKKTGKETADAADSSSPFTSKRSTPSTDKTSASSTAADRSPTVKTRSVDLPGSKGSPKFSSSARTSSSSSTPPGSPSTHSPGKHDASSSAASSGKTSSSTRTDNGRKDAAQQDSLKDSNDKAAKLLEEKEKILKELEEKTQSLEQELNDKDQQLRKNLEAKDAELETLKEVKDQKEKELKDLQKRLADVEKESREARQQGEAARSTSTTQGQREQWEKGLLELRAQVSAMEEQCSQLERDNQNLLSKLKAQETQAHEVEEAQQQQQQQQHGIDHYSEVSGLQGDLKTSELEVEDLRSDNVELRHELKDLRREMEEMYDTFRENEMDEFRELQRELDLTTKNCRVLQFKLRKAERRADQVETDRQHYEEKLHVLQNQFESGDARNHIEALEEELRTAKEVSVRLHDELDLMEDRRNKALEDNRHLSELLEQTDKKQFRMEMEIDKLRDQIADLKQQLREKSPTRKEGTPDRRDVLGRQGSQEYDSAQLMRDLCDSVERETDLKEQLRFLEEESRMLRKKLAEMEDENEALRVQLKKLSVKASRWKEESEGRAGGHRKADDAAQERERLDSSDDETSVVTLKLQMALLEQELMTSQRGQAEAEKEAENLIVEVTSLERKLKEREQEAASRREEFAPPAPDAYYEEKVRELTQVADELRWRIIEKDREIERLSTASIAHARHHGHHHAHGSSRGDSGKRSGLKKSKSLDSDPVVEDLRRQLEFSQHDVTALRHQASMAREQREAAEREVNILRHQLQQQKQPSSQQQQQRQQQDQEKLTLHSQPHTATEVPSVQADDAALQNIELRDALRRGEVEQRTLRDQVRGLTEQLHALSRSSSSSSGSGSTPYSPRGAQLAAAISASPAAAGSPQPPSPLSTTTTSPTATPSPATTTTSPAATPSPSPIPPPTSSSSSSSWQPEIPHVPTLPDTLAAAVVVVVAGATSGEEEAERDSAASLRSSERGRRLQERGSRFEPAEAPVPTTTTTTTTIMAESEQGDAGTRGGDTTRQPQTAQTVVVAGVHHEETCSFPSPSTTSSSTSLTSTGVPRQSGGIEEREMVKQAGLGAEAGGVVVVVATPNLERRVVRVAEGESRESLMDKVLDLEEEMNDLLKVIKRLKDDQEAKDRQISSLRTELQDAEDLGRRTELQLLKEVDMLHDKNSVLSNLLDIIQERADIAEQELERHLQEHSAPSTRSASAVSQVSALSDASCGSDEVFLVPPAGGLTEKGQIIHRDWEAKLKNRIESLERLLAEERQKVSSVEKKLHLSAEHALAPSLSDDVKLRLREKELLQEELLENQRHLRVATDQIQGMRERLHALEDEHHRLKVDYGKLCQELDKRDLDSDQTEEDSDKTPENSVEPEGSLVALRAARLKTAATPSATNDDDPSSRTDSARDVTTEGVARSPDDVTALVHEVARYKLKSEQLEYKVEEISDIWRSKSAATEKEKQALEQQLKEKVVETSRMSDNLDTFRQELQRQSAALSRAEEKVHKHEEEVTRRQAAEHELHELLSHATERENSLRQLRETVVTRDERLKEKDDIIHYLNSQLEQRQIETQQLQKRIDNMTSRLSPQAVTPSKDIPPGKEVGETDLEKENARLREKARSLRMDMEQRDATHLELESSRQELERTSLGQAREAAELQAALNVAEEKLRLYETLSTTSAAITLENIKKESLNYFAEKEALAAEVTMLKHELTMCQQNARETTARLKHEVHNKLQQLKDETEAHQRLLPEMDRLRTQAERAYRLQQEQRLLRAEHQAMKIRYETRVEKMVLEHSKMLTTMEGLQKEKASDRELVEGVQKALTLMRDAYTQDQMRWEEEKAKLDKQIKKLSETREAVKTMQQRTSQLKEELSQQERSRVDLVNKFTTDRAAWDINKATLQGRINQLEEQVQRSRREVGSSQALETAWSKERAHQQKLLSEAHSLALDLQRQLTSRSQEAEESQRLLAAEMEKERLSWERERREKEQQLAELETRLQWQGSLQRRVMEIQQYAEREVQQARKERAEMTKRLVETRQQQARDARAMDEILTGLVRLRELGATLITEEEKPQATSAGFSDFDRDLLKYIKEAMTQITKSADQLTKTDSNGSARIRRSLSSSELELLREELNDLRQEGGDKFPVLDVAVAATDSTGRQSQPQRSSSLEGQSSDVTLPPLLRSLTPSYTLSKTPSYTSGTRSAQGSRATSPDVHHVTDFSTSRKFLETTPSAVTGAHRPSKETSPHRRSASPKTGPSTLQERQTHFSSAHSASAATTGLAISTATSTATTTTTTTSVSSRASRPRTLTKSLSVESQPTWMSKPTVPRSYSATTTPTQPGPTPPGVSDGEGRSSTLPRRRIGGLSPRTARKKFFEEAPPEKAAFLSWPERGKRQEGGGGGAPRSLHVQGVDPREVRRGAEEEHEWLLSRVVEVPPHPPHAMKTSVSWHEKMHHKTVTSPRAETSPTGAPLSERVEEDEEEKKEKLSAGADPSDSRPSKDAGGAALQGPQSKGKGGQSSAKDRRRLFKKSSSLDSEVGACIAHAGVTTLASPAAPSSFSPSDFLATLKGKLTFGRKSKEEPQSAPLCPPSPLFIPTTVPDIPLRPPPSASSATTTTTTATTTTSVSPWSGRLREDTFGTGDEDSGAVDSTGEESRGRGVSRRQGPHPRDSRGGDARDIRWRSMSADRATRPLMVHTDVIVPAQIWQFSETAV